MNTLKQTKDRPYTNGLSCKLDHPILTENRDLAITMLSATTKRLERMGKLEEYHHSIQNQLEKGILEPVPSKRMYITYHGINPYLKNNLKLHKLCT